MQAADLLTGQQMEVSLVECDKATKRLTMSQKAAAVVNCMKGLQVGQLVHGTVRNVLQTYALVEVDGVPMKRAMLHATSVSCQPPQSLVVSHACGGCCTLALLLVACSAGALRI